MIQFHVRFRGTEEFKASDIQGRLTVTGTDVLLETKAPLASPLIIFSIYLGGAFVLSGLLPLCMLLWWKSITVSPLLPLCFQTAWIVWAGGLLCAEVLMFLPLRRRRLTVFREEINDVKVQARELLVQTADQDIVVTTHTSADAQALITAVREGTTAPVTRPIKIGRESLFDNSGFFHQMPVTVSIQDGNVTLKGRAFPSVWRVLIGIGVWLGAGTLAMTILCWATRSIPEPAPVWSMLGIGVSMLACIIAGGFGAGAVITHGKRVERALSCSELRGIIPLHRYVTFLAPDAKLSERRYTLRTPSPEDAAALAQRLREGTDEPWQATGYPANEKNDARYLHRVMPEQSHHPGQVLIEKERVTFTGRSGIPHPWAVRGAMISTLLVYPLLVPVAGCIDFVPLLDAQDQHKIIYVAAAMLALICVYLPVSALLANLLPTRVAVPRRHVVHATRVGRQVMLVISSKISSHRLALTTETNGDAKALVEELSAAQT
ncbi:MAG TPA: hypothetical protein VGM23_06290 [Armatimonadota bacterium]